MRVALLAPIGNSLYALTILQLLSQEKGVELCAMLVRTPWSPRRVWFEWRRDGTRLARKVVEKWFLRGKLSNAGSERELLSLASELHLEEKTLFEWSHKHAVPVKSVSSHNSSSAEAFLKKVNPELILFTGGGLIRKNILDIPSLGVLNCHSGWLPEYRGMDVLEWAVLQSAGKHPQLGLSLHFMDSGVDTGPILLRKKVVPTKAETFESLRARMQPMMVELMVAGVKGLRDGRLKPQAQLPGQGKQYYVMHPRLRAAARKYL